MCVCVYRVCTCVSAFVRVCVCAHRSIDLMCVLVLDFKGDPYHNSVYNRQ